LRRAVAVVHAVDGRETRDVDVGVLVDFSVLYVYSSDLLEGPGSRVIARQKLRHDGEFLVRIDRFARSIEIRRSVAIGVIIAAVLVADAPIAVCVSAVGLGAGVDAGGVARVRCVGVGGVVSFPEIHF